MPKAIMRDLLYFDLDKASSIWSQFEGGLTTEISHLTEQIRGVDGGGSVGVPGVIQAQIGARGSERSSQEELRVLHHDLLTRVENKLLEVGLMTDLTQDIDSGSVTPDSIRGVIGDKPYLKAEGRSVIEDYKRLLAISQKTNDLGAFINRSAQEALKDTPQFKELETALKEAKEGLKQIKDRNQRAKAKAGIAAIQKDITAKTSPKLAGVEEWVLKGAQLWVETFMPNRINFRIYPFDSCPSFQVLCNLKADCFVDQNLEHLLYGYGPRPNVLLSVAGLITSIPPEGGYCFDPLAEFAESTTDSLLPNDADDESEESKRLQFERAFRAIFGAMEGLEEFVRYSRYPNVTIHPIAVYRELGYGTS